MSDKRGGQTLTKFLGVNLRQDAASLADEDVVASIDADLHTQPGAILTRPGHRRLYPTGLATPLIYAQAIILGRRYQASHNAGSVSGVWYRNGTSIVSGISTTEFVASVVGVRPLNNTATYAFLANDASMNKDDGTTTSLWGIVPPTAVPTVAVGAVGSLTGNYFVKYTYVRVNGSTVEHESNPSPSSLVVALTADQLNIAGMTASSDAQVTHKRIYRTVAGGSKFFFDQQITNATTTATSTQVDSLLGAEVESDNDRPNDAALVVEWQEQLWTIRDPDNPHYLWRSKRFRPESFPAINFLEIGTPDDPLQAMARLTGLLGVFSRKTKYRVTGSEAGGYVVQEALSRRGTPCTAAVATEEGAVFVARDGVFLTNFITADQELSAKIAPIFYGERIRDTLPINWDAAKAVSLATFKGRLYVAYATGAGSDALPSVLAVYSRETRNWYFYSVAAEALYYDEVGDRVLAGRSDGIAWVLDDTAGIGRGDGYEATASTTAPLLDVRTANRFGETLHTRKLFLWVRLDADTPTGATVTVRLYVDDVLKRTVTGVTTTRGKALLAFPEASMGYTWAVQVVQTGVGRVKVFGVAAIWEPLAAA